MENLRKLVQRMVPAESGKTTNDSSIFRPLVARPDLIINEFDRENVAYLGRSFAALPHRSEFEHPEVRPVHAYTPMRNERRLAGKEQHRDRDSQEQGTQHQEQDRR